MQGVHLNHSTSFTYRLLAVKHRIGLKDLKKENVIILKR